MHAFWTREFGKWERFETPSTLVTLTKQAAKYRSFFTVLNEVRLEVGDDALPEWCRNELAIGLSVTTNTASVLGKIDGEIVKADLAAANKIEEEKEIAAQKAREDARSAFKAARAASRQNDTPARPASAFNSKT